MSQWPLRRRRVERFPPAALLAENLSKSFAGLRRTFPALRRKPEKERSASKQVGKKPGVELLRVRATSGASAPERARQETSTHTVYDRHSIEETSKRSRIASSRPHHLQRAFESAQS